jgi:hypothetical protein
MRLGVAGREYRHLADHILGDYRRAIRRWHRLMGSLTKNWSKLLTRRSTVVGTLCDAGRRIVGNSVKQLPQKIGTFKQSRSLPSAYLPFIDGGQEGDWSRQGSGPIWHGATFPFRFSNLPTGNAATDYFSPHSRISFQRHSSAVSPPRMAVSCSSLNVTRSTATLARYLDEAWLRAPGDLADEF